MPLASDFFWSLLAGLQHTISVFQRGLDLQANRLGVIRKGAHAQRMSAIFAEDFDMRYKEIILGIALVPTVVIGSVDFNVRNFVQINVDWGVDWHDVWFVLGQRAVR